MREDLDRLAQRFRRALDAQEEARRREAEARRARAEEARRARADLLDELVAFGQAVGVDTSREGDVLTWRQGDRAVSVRPADDALEVAWREQAPRTARLYREERLGHRWVLAVQPPAEERLPLVEAGLVRLLVQGLGLPPPDGG